MFVSQGQLLAHDLVTHETWSVLPDMSYVATFAVRPTSV